MNRDKARVAIYALGGVYLLYLAWQLFDGLDTAAGSERILCLVFMVLFAVIGAAAVIWGIYMGWKQVKELQNPQSEECPEEEEVLEDEELLEAESLEDTEVEDADA